MTTDTAPKASPAAILGLFNSLELRLHTLKPRAQAALCCLRSGGKTNIQIRAAIGDQKLDYTRDLLRDLRAMFMVGQRMGSERWYLTWDSADGGGVGWLETNGLSVAQGARL